VTSAETGPQYDELVTRIYRGALEERPWQGTLPALRQALDARVASLILRPPTPGDRGVILNSLRPESGAGAGASSLAAGDDWEVAAYQEQFFALDPFVNLPLERVIALEDILPEPELLRSDYYLHYLAPIGLFRILGVDTRAPDGTTARLRFSRGVDEPRFSGEDRQLLSRITPHLRQALEIYARLYRMTSERDIYAGAVDQLAVATIIVDEQGLMLNTNAVASALLAERDGIYLRGKELCLASGAGNRALREALAHVISAQRSGAADLVRALRVPRSAGRSDLGLVIRPAPPGERGEGQSGPCAAVFISDPDLREPASQQILGELFGLTPAEANVAILLARGLSLAEVAQAQGITQNTARVQLKSVFAKTGASRQAELVRLVLKSVASLA